MIQFLLDKGSNPNVISIPKKPKCWDRPEDIGGTAFDLFAQQLRTPYTGFNVSEVSDSIRLTIFDRLEAEGSQFSKPFDSTAGIRLENQFELFIDEIQRYTVFEEQVECLRFFDPENIYMILTIISVRSRDFDPDYLTTTR